MMKDENIYFNSRRVDIDADKGEASVNVGQDNDSIVDVNLEPNINITIPESGMVAAGTGVGMAAAPAILPAAKATGLAATKFAAAVPVIGQVIAAAAIIVSIGQMFDAAAKQKQLQLALKNLKVQSDLIKSEVDILQYGASLKLDVYNKALQRNAEKEKLFQTYKIITGSLVGVASLLLIYSLVKKK